MIMDDGAVEGWKSSVIVDILKLEVAERVALSKKAAGEIFYSCDDRWAILNSVEILFQRLLGMIRQALEERGSSS